MTPAPSQLTYHFMDKDECKQIYPYCKIKWDKHEREQNYHKAVVYMETWELGRQSYP